MADANAGTLSVAITGDISDLLAALQQAQDAAVAAGAAIAAALTQGGGNDFSSVFEETGAAAEQAANEVEQFANAAQNTSDAGNQAVPAVQNLGTEVHNAGEEAVHATISFDELLQKVLEYTGIHLGIDTIRELADAIIEASSRAEDLALSLSRISGSTEGAAEQVEKLEQLAIALGQPFADVSDAARRLTSDLQDFGGAEAIIELASDAAAQSGRNFESLTQVLDRMAQQGVLSTRSLQQLGISADDMAEALGKDTNDITDLKKAFDDLSTGGRIEALQEAMSNLAGASQQHAQTMSGQWAQFANIFEQQLKKAGDAVAPFLKVILELASTIVKVYGDVATGLVDVFKAINEGLFNPTKALSDIQAGLAAFKNVGADIADTFKLKATPALDEFGDALKNNGQIVGKVKEQFNDVDDELNTFGKTFGELTVKASDEIDKFRSDFDNGFDTKKDIASLVSMETALDDFIAKIKNSAAGATDAGKNLIAYAQSERDAIATIVEDANVQQLPVVAEKMTAATMKELDAFNEFGIKLPPIAATISAGMMDIMMEQTAYQQSLDDLPTDMGASRWTQLLNPIGQLTADFKALGMTIGDDVTAKLAAFGDAFVSQMNLGNLSVAQLQEGFDKLLAEVTKFPDLAQKWLPALQQSLDDMEAMHGVSLQILDDQVKQDQLAITAAVNNGQSAQSVLQLAENMNTAAIRAQTFKDASSSLATLYQGITKEFSAAWTSFGTGIGDAIAGTESFHQAFANALTDLEKKLSELVVNYLLGQLKDALLQNTNLVNDFNSLFNSVFGTGGAVAAGLSGTQSAIKQTGQAMTTMLDDEGNVIQQTMSKVTQGVNQVGSAAISSLSSIFNLVTGALTAIASIISAFELGHIEKELATIEGETRRTANAVEIIANLTLDADQHLTNIDGILNGAMYTVIVNISSDLDVIAANMQALLGIAESGGLGGGSGGSSTNAAIVQMTSQLAAANTMIQNLRDELAQLGAATTSNTSAVGSASASVGTYTTATNTATSAISTATAALSNLSTAIAYTENSVGNLGDVFVSAANVIQQIVAPGSISMTPMSGAFSSTPPNFTYNPGAFGPTSGPLFQGNNPGSAPWSPSTTTFGQAMAPNVYQINVNSPSSQTTASQIVQALRNNAGLKV